VVEERETAGSVLVEVSRNFFAIHPRTEDVCADDERCACPGGGVRNEYTIAYAPVNQALDGTYRAIQLKVAGPDHSSVRTRPGYWATPTSP